MKKYAEINKLHVIDGDIIRVLCRCYDDNIISQKWAVHFVDCIKFFKVDSVNNNGTIKAHDLSGKLKTFCASDSNVLQAFRCV